MRRYRFYHQETGIIHPSRFATTHEPSVVNNTPADHVAIEADLDHLTQRVAVEIPKGEDDRHPIIAHQAPQMVAPDWQTRRLRLAELRRQSEIALRKHVIGDTSAADQLRAIDTELAKLESL